MPGVVGVEVVNRFILDLANVAGEERPGVVCLAELAVLLDGIDVAKLLHASAARPDAHVLPKYALLLHTLRPKFIRELCQYKLSFRYASTSSACVSQCYFHCIKYIGTFLDAAKPSQLHSKRRGW